MIRAWKDGQERWTTYPQSKQADFELSMAVILVLRKEVMNLDRTKTLGNTYIHDSVQAIIAIPRSRQQAIP